MYSFSRLEQEFLRSTLLGVKKKYVREPEVILADLRQEWGDSSETRLQIMEQSLTELRSLKEEARILATNGLQADSLEYDALLQKAQAHSDFAGALVQGWYVTACQNAAGLQDDEELYAPVKKSEWPADWKQPEGKEVVASGKTKYFPQTAGECMYQYCFYGLWDEKNNSVRTERMDMQRMRYLKLTSGNSRQFTRDKAWADQWLAKASALLAKNTFTQEDKDLAEVLGGPLPKALQKKIEENEKNKVRGAAVSAHQCDITAPVSGGSPVNTVVRANAAVNLRNPVGGIGAYHRHVNDIFLLEPAKEWALYVDESGSDWEYNTGCPGVIAGVLTDLANPLPPQKRLHAGEDDTEELMIAGDKVIQTVLDHPQTGVLAIPSSAYRFCDGWGASMASFIDLVLRLLPLDGETKLTIYVETRASYSEARNFEHMRDACRFKLMHSLPDRASKIEFDILPMNKENPFNAYPDLVAHTCRKRKENPVATQRFKAADWNQHCFLDYDASQLCNLLDHFHAGIHLPAADWAALISKAENTTDNIVSAVMQTFGQEVQGNLSLWQELLAICVDKLDSKAIHLHSLRNLILFLKKYQPLQGKMPPRVRLLWLSAKLAEANHRGHAIVSGQKDFIQLIKSLFCEDAPLATFAVLHMVVTLTNAYRFEDAKQILENFCQKLIALGYGGTPEAAKPDPFSFVQRADFRKGIIAIPGTRYFAQMLSSHGQHLAFLGENEEAKKFFLEAIAYFRNLSDPETAKLEISQTSAYLLTSLMDLPEEKSNLFSQTLAEYFGEDLVAAARKLAVDASPANKYRHHILLRLIHSGKVDIEVKKAYLVEKQNWAFSNDGHPWELIAFYRALLLDDPAERMKWLQTAYNMTKGEDAALHVIGAVIFGAMLTENQSLYEEYEKLIQCCEKEVPALGERLEILRGQPIKLLSPLELAQKVLPFNFR